MASVTTPKKILDSTIVIHQIKWSTKQIQIHIMVQIHNTTNFLRIGQYIYSGLILNMNCAFLF